MNPQTLYHDAGPTYSSFYDTQYMYQQHHATLPSPPTSPQFSWQVTTIDEDAHTHTYNDKIPSAKARRTQIPAETMSSLMTGPDPVDGKYVCLYGGCMRRFGRKYNIQSHIQTHLADRPFRCSVCAAGFVRRHDLVRHARIHGTGKDFVCGCGKGFSRMDALNRHRQRQICIGGTGKPDGRKARSSPSKRSTKTQSSLDSDDGGESYRDSSDSASPEPDLCAMNQSHLSLHAAPRVHEINLTGATESFSEFPGMLDGTTPMFEKHSPLEYSQPPMQRQHSQYSGARTPVYVAPVARYAVSLESSPNRLLDQEMWVNPSLISPAMTNSSQFHSEGEEGQYYY